TSRFEGAPGYGGPTASRRGGEPGRAPNQSGLSQRPAPSQAATTDRASGRSAVSSWPRRRERGTSPSDLDGGSPALPTASHRRGRRNQLIPSEAPPAS